MAAEEDNEINPNPSSDTPIPDPGQEKPGISTEPSIVTLDTEIMEILGADPTNSVKYGAEIRPELASRMQHWATEGLCKDSRKELLEKYILPSNCQQIGAPTINVEIKAAIPTNILNRDRGIELKQKQMASAISCLTEVINSHISSKDTNNSDLQKLMDVVRLLCDIQHADSVTRRNFMLFALKKDISQHLAKTKIDSFLFGKDLPETLKSAKAVNKTSAEIKSSGSNKISTRRPIVKPGPPPKLLRHAGNR